MQESGLWFSILPDQPPRQFQVFGERGSGTNVVRKLIERNSVMSRTEGLGWKHGFPIMPGIPRACMVVNVLRHAESWALTMHKRPWHLDPAFQALGFSDFIRAEWHSIVDRPSDFEFIHSEIDAQGRPLQLDRHPITGKRFTNLFQLRSCKLAALAGMINRGCSLAYVKMETVLQDDAAFMRQFRDATDIAPKRSEHRSIKRRMGHRFNHSAPDRPATPAEMSAEDRAFMHRELDLELEAAFGYEYPD